MVSGWGEVYGCGEDFEGRSMVVGRFLCWLCGEVPMVVWGGFGGDEVNHLTAPGCLAILTPATLILKIDCREGDLFYKEGLRFFPVKIVSCKICT